MSKILRKFRSILFMHITWPYILILIIILLTSTYAFSSKIENWFIFFPQSSFDITPDNLHMNYLDINFHSKDGEKLHGWFFPGNKDAPVVLFCHGNACNISHMLEHTKSLIEKGLQVFLFDYRGYGNSTGTPSEEGIYMDAQAAYDYLTKEQKIPPDKIVMFGQSLGAAAAIDVALKNNIRSIILESAFTSIKDMSRKTFPLNMISFLVPSIYNNLGKIGEISAPKLFIHGEDDEIVPFEMGKRLFNASKEPKYFYAIKGAGHNDTYFVGGERYFNTLADFVYNSQLDKSGF